MNAYPHYPGRRILSLNGNWQFRFTEGVPLEKADDPGFRADSLMTVPGAFDAMPEWFGKRGTGLYRTVFTLDSPCRRALLKLDGIGLRGRFRLDGRESGFPSLPYSAVGFEAGPLAAGRHELTAAVDNCFDSKAMKLFLPYYDFYGFGGFYRGAELHLLDGDYALDRVQVRTADCRNGEVELRFLFSGDVPEHLDCRIAFDTSRAPVERQLAIVHNRAGLRLAVPAFETWSPERPALHTVTVSAGTERIVERFGIREISTDGNRLLLNGKPLFLKGVNRHEFHPEFGPAVPPQLMLEDLQNLRRMNCNFVRGSHYPQDCRFLDLCDEAGLLVWEESLGWGNTAEQMADPEFIRLQELQTRLMVRGSVNHPAVILWGFLNEFDSASPQGYALCTRLAEAIREEDGSRPITFACNHVDADICAGLVRTVLFMHDIIIPRDASQQAYVGEHIDIALDFSNVKRGDLVFFGRKATAERKEGISHVGIYLGNKQFIHALGDVHVSSMNPADQNYDEFNTKRLLFAVRFLPYINKEKGMNTTNKNPFYQ